MSDLDYIKARHAQHMASLESMPALDSVAEANRLLSEAGWRPINSPAWGGTFCSGRLVGGESPGGTQYVKNLDAVLPGDPRYGPDTPDEPHEAAAWLIEHARQRENTLTTSATLEAIDATDDLGAADGDVGMDFVARGDGDTGGRDAGAGLADDLGGGPGDFASEGEGDGAGARSDVGENASGSDDEPHAAGGSAIDAEYVELGDDAIAGDDASLPELGAEILETEAESEPPPPQNRFYGLDDLDRRRSLRIGDVVRIALEKMPRLRPEDDLQLMELRNFAMGVSEGRWPNDLRKQADLEALEMIFALARQIEAARDDKVAFLVAASREQIEAFDPLDGWP